MLTRAVRPYCPSHRDVHTHFSAGTRMLTTLRSLIRRATLVAALAAGTLSAQAAPTAAPVLFRGVRVFDGARAVASQDVLVENGRITRVARSIAAPAGAEVIDGAGKTLLPGMIDSHTHVWPGALEAALAFGVTTELDMFSDPNAARTARDQQRAGTATRRADMLSAGTLVTAPGGHGTQFGTPIPTITEPGAAQAFVDARIAEGSDYIKIVFDGGQTYGTPWPSLNIETLRALITATHARQKLAIVHIGDLASARAAIGAGADGLVHLFVDKAPDAEFAAFVAQHRAFVIPTMTVLKSIAGIPGGSHIIRDPLLTPYFTRTDLTMLGQAFPSRPNAPAKDYANAVATVRALHRAGVTILAGTDAANPGTAHGASMHGELELLVEAGLSPAEALAAATSVPARTFKLNDRGRIAAGLRADLFLVEGDPTADIKATRAIVGIWKEGVRFDRAAVAAAVASAQVAASQAPRGAESGLVSDFDAGTMATSFGAGWSVSDDAMANGRSSGRLNVVDGGANGSAKSLEITGTISNAVPYAWAGAMFTPGEQMMMPVNLSSKREVRFWARGDGKTYRVMIFAESKGFTPQMQSFVAGAEWKEFVFPLSAFGGTDGRDLMALIIAGGPAPGEFSLRIDDVRFR